MGFKVQSRQFHELLQAWRKEYVVYAPKRFTGGGRFSDTDCIRYGEVSCADEIVFHEKSNYSFKEILVPVSQTLFYFTEGETKEAEMRKKGAVIFLRSCDLHALKRLDDMYLGNGPEDYYYSRLRENLKIVLMGCEKSFDNCFCVSMGSNLSQNYDMSVDEKDGNFYLDIKDQSFAAMLKEILLNEKAENGVTAEMNVIPCHVTENAVKVTIPANLTAEVAKSQMWREYDGRCINCGRCNFACPTCTCFTMQDLFYDANGKVGERRRVQASCMVDGFTDVAGGGKYRQKNGDRMRFKVLHKVLDYRQRKGYDMCVGCGRCDDICPEYISFSNCVNKLDAAMKEVTEHGAE